MRKDSLADNTETGKGLPPRDLVRILDLAVDRVTMAEALDRLDLMVKVGGPFQVLTPNVDHIMRVRKDPEFRRVYEEGDLVVADGTPLVWASRLLGDRLPERVSGSDLVPCLCGLAAKYGYSVYLMGGQPGAAAASSRILQVKYPGLRIAGHACPPLGFHLDPAVNKGFLEHIRKAKPDLLFVALGAPKQEIWIHRHKVELGVPVSIGVGATLDFIAGIVKRAPRFTHRLGVEWLWRLLCESRRLWRRYLVNDLPFVWKIAGQWWEEKRSRRSGKALL